ncbi:hypothetical protein [Streptacidiphilus cavernicola]|uniref:Secreted protein n=1 Tax=Streptacidiphilus cavernicola TaxID=3342716 RepID=A0ABV6W1Q7_9ACTN
MIKKVLAGALLAVSATVPMTGVSFADGTYGSHYGDTLVGSQDGAINDNSAPFADVDLRCAVANATGVAGVWGNENSCNDAPVDQFHQGGILGG